MAADRPLIHRFETLDSTQELAHRLAAEGAPHGTVIVAAVQTKGRGTRGREWVAPHGGLWVTVVLRPAAPPALEGLSLRVGLAVARTLDQWIPEPIQLKWPNDLIGAGRKTGGILCEARWIGETPGWVAVGVGINVTNPIPPALADTTSRLADLGCQVRADELVEPVAAAVAEAGAGIGLLSDREIAEFASRDWLAGRLLLHPVAGRAVGIAPDGRLIVETETGERVPVLGSVTLAGLAPGAGSR